MSNKTLTKKPKVIVCDIDKTLTLDDVWYTLTSELHGDIEEHYQLYTSYVKKHISLAEMKKGLFDMWRKGYGGPIPRKVIEDIFFKVNLRGEAFAVFSDLRNKGYTLCLLSSYMDMFVEQVAQKLQIKQWFANSEFIFDGHGYWVDYHHIENEGEYKLQQLRNFLKEQKINDDECLILGGGHEELELFKNYPGIAINTDYQDLIDIAWKEVKYLPTVLQLLNRFE